MNYRLTTILLAVGMLVMLGASTIQAAPEPTVQPAALAGNYDFATFGTEWQPQIRGQFTWFVPRDWGTQAKAAGGTDRWVHIAIPFATYIAGTPMKIKHIEFCAQSTNGAGGTKPVYVKGYSDTGNYWLAANTSGTWTDNALHCWFFDDPAPSFFPNLGLSVQLHFANTGDMITLYKAWVSVVP
jgi:hypothetical protein